jgi:hypothetical protein
MQICIPCTCKHVNALYLSVFVQAGWVENMCVSLRWVVQVRQATKKRQSSPGEMGEDPAAIYYFTKRLPSEIRNARMPRSTAHDLRGDTFVAGGGVADSGIPSRRSGIGSLEAALHVYGMQSILYSSCDSIDCMSCDRV